jgi:hypothetical protein
VVIITEGVRRCDSRCHHAKSPNCRCVCGGRYHGAGDGAQEQLTTDVLGEGWRERKRAIEANGGSFEATVLGALRSAQSMYVQGDLPLGVSGS